MEPNFAGIPDGGLEEKMQIYSNKVYFLCGRAIREHKGQH
jgi:hypothetical protein